MAYPEQSVGGARPVELPVNGDCALASPTVLADERGRFAALAFNPSHRRRSKGGSRQLVDVDAEAEPEADPADEGLMRYFANRLGFFALSLWAAITINFFLPRLMPGNPAEVLIARFQGRINPRILHAIELQFG